ncbi:MAG: WYL domain-containing protein, partial [Oscillospiraceae bacterium]|nr:WYL domain-containing protein [Oscillospiraceae bacterium]
MPRSSNQKLKLLKLAEIFREETNEEHPITISRLIEMLDGMDIKAERKSLYDDIDTLCLCGMEIEKTGASRNTGYYYVGGKFELQELKLLADAVACSKFITEKKSEVLVEKLSSLTNR